jgi:hypothetical protein
MNSVMHPIPKLSLTALICAGVCYGWGRIPAKWPEKPRVMLPEIRYITVTNYVSLPSKQPVVAAFWETNGTWHGVTNNNHDHVVYWMITNSTTR